jgi:C-terminal processing protease CtpA/Prc
MVLAQTSVTAHLAYYKLHSDACHYLLWSKSGTQGALTGVGLSIGYPLALNGSPAGLSVMSAAPGGPAEKAGIVSGDVILAIDDRSAQDMDIYDAADRLQ